MCKHLASRVHHKPTVLSYEALAMKRLLGEIDTALIAPATYVQFFSLNFSRPLLITDEIPQIVMWPTCLVFNILPTGIA